MCETPKKCHLFPSHRRVDGNQGAMIEKMNEAGIRKNLMMHYLSEETQGRRNVGFTERDMRNYLRSKRAKTFEKGDAQCLLDYLNEKQLENPHFFYAIQLDAEAQMTIFFGLMQKQEWIIAILEMWCALIQPMVRMHMPSPLFLLLGLTIICKLLYLDVL